MTEKTPASPAPRSKAEREADISAKLDAAQQVLFDPEAETGDKLANALAMLDSAIGDINEGIEIADINSSTRQNIADKVAE